MMSYGTALAVILVTVPALAHLAPCAVCALNRNLVLCTMRRMRPDRVRSFQSTFPLLLSIVTPTKHYIIGKAKDRAFQQCIENGTFQFEILE